MTMNNNEQPIAPSGKLRIVGYMHPRSVTLVGDKAALRNLSRVFRPTDRVVTIALSTPRPSPVHASEQFVQAIKVIVVEGPDSPVEIEIQDDVLVFTGAVDDLDVLAHDIQILAETGESPISTDLGKLRDHIHFEYYPGIGYLSPTALPVYVSFDESDSE